jgi:hypothetical protein
MCTATLYFVASNSVYLHIATTLYEVVRPGMNGTPVYRNSFSFTEYDRNHANWTNINSIQLRPIFLQSTSECLTKFIRLNMQQLPTLTLLNTQNIRFQFA